MGYSSLGGRMVKTQSQHCRMPHAVSVAAEHNFPPDIQSTPDEKGEFARDILTD